jgi:hypothetical protein
MPRLMLALRKREYIGSDPKMGSGSEKNSFGSKNTA